MANIKTGELIEQENKEAMARAEAISRAALEVEEIFLRYDFNWEECGQVIDRLTERTLRVLGKVRLRKIKNDYERLNQ